MKVLELFCGTKSFSKVAEERGYETFTVDINSEVKPDLCKNILDFDIKDLPIEWRNPDIIWASPPCQTFSVMTIPHYWKNNRPKKSKTLVGMAIAMKTKELIKELNPKYYIIENPMGMMRKQFFMIDLPRKTVTYCKYGKNYRKATDLWTNISQWIPRKTCSPGDSCHEEARRGMRRGIQGKVNPNLPGMAEWAGDSLARGVIPIELCNEILDACEGKQKIKQLSLIPDKQNEVNRK